MHSYPQIPSTRVLLLVYSPQIIGVLSLAGGHYCRSEAKYSIISPQRLQQLFGFPAGLTIPGEAAPLPLCGLQVFAMSLVLTLLNI